MGNFIDRTFGVMADILLKLLPASKQEKDAFSYYRAGMGAQTKGQYNYYEALDLEEDPYDRSFILYNIGLLFGNNGEYTEALEYYHEAIELNSDLPQAYNNIAVIYHAQGVRILEWGDQQTTLTSLERREDDALAKRCFDEAAKYWRVALELEPNGYQTVRNWFNLTNRPLRV